MMDIPQLAQKGMTMEKLQSFQKWLVSIFLQKVVRKLGLGGQEGFSVRQIQVDVH